MSKHLIFLIHGMGEHKRDWSAGVQTLLLELFNTYKRSSVLPFEDHFEFVEVTYDHLFEELRDRWRESSLAVLDSIEAGGASSRLLETVTKIGGAGGSTNFFTTHILDVLLYRFIALIRDPVRIHVGHQIVDRLRAVPSGESMQWSFVAHSLGTSVIHDALHLMFSDRNGIEGINLDRRQHGPAVGLFLANVSRVLQNEIDVYSASLVRPSLQKKDGILDFFLNARHKLDPFTRVKPFEPDHDWVDSRTRTLRHRRFADLSITAVTDPNVHGFDHYLANPTVHVPFFRALFRNQSVIPVREGENAKEAFLEKARNAGFAGIRNDLQELVENEGPDLASLLESGSRYYKIIGK